MGHLESAELPNPIAIGVQCDYRVGDVADRDGDRQDVDRDALRVQDHRETLRDVEVDVELGDPLPRRARLRDQAPKLGWRLIGLPVTYLDTHATPTAPTSSFFIRAPSPRNFQATTSSLTHLIHMNPRRPGTTRRKGYP